ncbi:MULTISPECIES: 4-hydroxy-tetrahydrodipicolinate synthase [Caproicibacterium]|jgi:4-hydroxy-tetrahydrodipicolinate synthase|uniref:4-hydroxy-tetrahydrodipicolinate synthase n=1 Tax=Caproicibacterium lactatifermentans TaxID=2666138 RepID=A0ABX6PXF7_9FIRM|nr:4-hydroxy-tetrahydrodipicolinate synthase [Caproicibacterium lactatifermentans]ARP50327.1 4-hydroxy-tetrahydrodipicolinate synthase [Ruminococcaceae bacterium CPB6]QKO30978.1 4-hydroxy-tetrahydrodipicolinate synthase [Caproicibacterium lactatifermentans]
MKHPIFTGSAVALVTPFSQDGSVNYEMLDRLLELHLSSGTDAVVLCATTGESPVLTAEEYKKVLQRGIQKVAGRVPVIAGAGSNCTATALQLCKTAQEAGADALLVVTPFYNKTSQNGLIAHYTYLADRVNKPIIIYNVPSRTGVNVKPETYQILAKHPMINGVKEANGDITSVARTISLCKDNFNVYSGNDDQALPMLSLGGKGVISVFANCLPHQMHELCRAYLDGDTKQAASLEAKYLPLMDALFMDINPIPVKEALRMMGYDCGICRLPLVEMDDAAKKELASVLKRYGLIL